MIHGSVPDDLLTLTITNKYTNELSFINNSHKYSLKDVPLIFVPKQSKYDNKISSQKIPICYSETKIILSVIGMISIKSIFAETDIQVTQLYVLLNHASSN